MLGGAFIGIIALITDWQQWPQFFEKATCIDYLLIIYLAIFSSFLTFWIMQKATLVLSPTQIMAYNFIVPVIPLILLWLTGLPQLNWIIVPGVLMVSFAMYLLAKTKVKT